MLNLRNNGSNMLVIIGCQDTGIPLGNYSLTVFEVMYSGQERVFSDAVELYEADRKLRALMHDGMERVEIAMRTRVGEVLIAKDPLAYTDQRRFRQTFDHQRWMETLNRRIARAGKSNESIKHYQEKYDGRYPFWVLAELLDFADISRTYEGLPVSDQRIIR